MPRAAPSLSGAADCVIAVKAIEQFSKFKYFFFFFFGGGGTPSSKVPYSIYIYIYIGTQKGEPKLENDSIEVIQAEILTSGTTTPVSHVRLLPMNRPALAEQGEAG